MSFLNVPTILTALSSITLASTIAVTEASGAKSAEGSSQAMTEAGKGHTRGDRGHKARGGKHHRRGGLCKDIGCTEAQKKKLGELREQTRAKAKAERTAVRELRQKIAGEYKKASPNQRKMQALHQELQHRRNAIGDARWQSMMNMHAVLTPEQRAKVADHWAHRGGHRGRHGHGHGHGHGKGKGKHQKGGSLRNGR